MDEHILGAIIGLDESIALGFVEPLHLASRQVMSSPRWDPVSAANKSSKTINEDESYSSQCANLRIVPSCSGSRGASEIRS
jgi:hypothetical protein